MHSFLRSLAPCLLLLPLLAGCVSSEELAQADDRECRELGFEPGTEGYGNCRLKLREIRALERQALAVESNSMMHAWPGSPYW